MHENKKGKDTVLTAYIKHLASNISVAALIGLISSAISLFTALVSLPGEFLKINQYVVYFILVTVTISLVITLFVALLRRRTSSVNNLKRKTTSAFMLALDQSSFNPHRFKENLNE